MDKFDMISRIIIKVDKLMDAKGIEKATLGIEIVQLLNTLSKGLGDEDKAHAAEKKLLEDQLKPAPPKDGCTRVGGETITFDLEPENMMKLEAGINGADDDAE